MYQTRVHLSSCIFSVQRKFPFQLAVSVQYAISEKVNLFSNQVFFSVLTNITLTPTYNFIRNLLTARESLPCAQKKPKSAHIQYLFHLLHIYYCTDIDEINYFPVYFSSDHGAFHCSTNKINLF